MFGVNVLRKIFPYVFPTPDKEPDGVQEAFLMQQIFTEEDYRRIDEMDFVEDPCDPYQFITGNDCLLKGCSTVCGRNHTLKGVHSEEQSMLCMNQIDEQAILHPKDNEIANSNVDDISVVDNADFVSQDAISSGDVDTPIIAETPNLNVTEPQDDEIMIVNEVIKNLNPPTKKIVLPPGFSGVQIVTPIRIVQFSQDLLKLQIGDKVWLFRKKDNQVPTNQLAFTCVGQVLTQVKSGNQVPSQFKNSNQVHLQQSSPSTVPSSSRMEIKSLPSSRMGIEPLPSSKINIKSLPSSKMKIKSLPPISKMNIKSLSSSKMKIKSLLNSKMKIKSLPSSRMAITSLPSSSSSPVQISSSRIAIKSHPSSSSSPVQILSSKMAIKSLPSSKMAIKSLPSSSSSPVQIPSSRMAIKVLPSSRMAIKPLPSSRMAIKSLPSSSSSPVQIPSSRMAFKSLPSSSLSQFKSQVSPQFKKGDQVLLPDETAACVNARGHAGSSVGVVGNQAKVIAYPAGKEKQDLYIFDNGKLFKIISTNRGNRVGFPVHNFRVDDNYFKGCKKQ